ncbi:MAG TPA: GNAT family protein [Ktedonobacterales bacterium]|nr:GNAT family protein [Ktedonobacterales bacterium]
MSTPNATPPHFQQLQTARLTVRRFDPGDLPTLLAYRNDPDVARYQSWETVSEREARTLIEEQQTEEPGRPLSWFQFAFALNTTNELIGDALLHVGSDSRLGEVGYTLASAYQKQGYAQEGMRAILAYAFETLGLHRIMAVLDCRNTPSARLLERLGMRREGHFLQNAWYKGEWCDEYEYALLRSEWLRRQENG